MQNSKIKPITEAEYLKMERESETKHEYFQGEIFAMTGASRKHNLIAINLIRELSNKLRRGTCRVYPSDMRVNINKAGDYVYPDVTIVCEKENFSDKEEDTITNPDVIIEIISKSTEAYDRGEKFAHYRKIESLKEYVLVSQDKKQIEKYSKNDTGFWQLEEFGEDAPEVTFSAVNCKLNIDDVYENVI